MTSPAAWYQARTAKTRTTQPPALVTPLIVAPAPIDSRTRNRLSAELSWATGMLVTYKVSNAPNITQNGP